MGGSVAVAIRKKSGEVICKEGWTNDTPYWFKNVRMRNGDEEWIDAYLSTLSGDSDLPLSPEGYGLTVIDFVTNHFLTMQGYCGYDNFSELDGFGSMKEEMNKVFREQAEAGLLTAKIFLRNEKTPILEYLPAETAMERAKAIYDVLWDRKYNEQEREYSYVSFLIDMKPMIYMHYGDPSTSSCQKFRSKLIELGFNLTIEDEAGWARTIADYNENEEENA